MYLQYFVLQFGSFAIPEQITFLRQKVPTLGDLHCWHMMQNLAFDAVEKKTQIWIKFCDNPAQISMNTNSTCM